MDQMMTIKDLAAYLHKSEATARKLIVQMNPSDVSTTPGRHQYLVSESNVEDWLYRRSLNIRIVPDISTARRSRKPVAINEYTDQYGRALRKKGGKLVPMATPPNEKRPPRRATATKEQAM